MTRTADEVHADLLDAREAFIAAVEDGDIDGAKQQQAALDALLDERIHLPQQRTPSAGS